jgi:hypothetical protein
MKAGITTSCTTRYNASSGGQSLETVCPDTNNITTSSSEDNDDDGAIAPLRSTHDTPSLVSWRDLGFNLLNSMSLNNGVFDGDASIARILTQLQLTENTLNKTLPSPAEALASIMTCTVLDLTQNFPFQPLGEGMGIGEGIQYFNATVRVAQYMSGGEKGYQKVRSTPFPHSPSPFLLVRPIPLHQVPFPWAGLTNIPLRLSYSSCS